MEVSKRRGRMARGLIVAALKGSVQASAMAPRGPLANILFESIRVGQRRAAAVMDYANDLAHAPASARSYRRAARNACLFGPGGAALADDLCEGGHAVVRTRARVRSKRVWSRDENCRSLRSRPSRLGL
jgi:hypothetical protein